MDIGVSNKTSIQLTLYDYFMDIDSFSIQDAQNAVKEANLKVKEPSVRARIYEGINKGLFERIAKNVYTVKKTDENGQEATCMLINGDGRDLAFIEDNSIDSIITDHPYKLDKSLKGGNRDFANYESFQYSEHDMREKFRVLKPGCFLVEFLPEENGDNFEYIYQVKAMAKKVGFDYFAMVPWKKGDFVANTGRKSKNTEQVLFFTKGKCRNLRIDAKKEKEFFATHVLVELHDIIPVSKHVTGHMDGTSDTSYSSEIKCDIKLYIKPKSESGYEQELIEDLWYDYSTKTLDMLSSEYEYEYLEQLSAEEYIKLYLEDNDYEFTDVTHEEFHIYMSGAKGMLPTVFDYGPVPKSEKIHQAEKPVELLEKILDFVSLPPTVNSREKVLDQFAGSGVLGEAALNKGLDSILIEKDEVTYINACERINKRKTR